nr:PREDICTED: ATP synthase gamma chain, chloroplastic-like isoform X2 [Nicotiana sylvestris]
MAQSPLQICLVTKRTVWYDAAVGTLLFLAKQIISISDLVEVQKLLGEHAMKILMMCVLILLKKKTSTSVALLQHTPSLLHIRYKDDFFMLTTKEGKMIVERDHFRVKRESELRNLDFEQHPAQILDAFMPLYLNSQILRALEESFASELAARMNAMSNAT